MVKGNTWYIILLTILLSLILGESSLEDVIKVLFMQ